MHIDPTPEEVASKLIISGIHLDLTDALKRIVKS